MSVKVIYFCVVTAVLLFTGFLPVSTAVLAAENGQQYNQYGSDTSAGQDEGNKGNSCEDGGYCPIDGNH